MASIFQNFRANGGVGVFFVVVFFVFFLLYTNPLKYVVWIKCHSVERRRLPRTVRVGWAAVVECTVSCTLRHTGLWRTVGLWRHGGGLDSGGSLWEVYGVLNEGNTTRYNVYPFVQNVSCTPMNPEVLNTKCYARVSKGRCTSIQYPDIAWVVIKHLYPEGFESS